MTNIIQQVASEKEIRNTFSTSYLTRRGNTGIMEITYVPGNTHIERVTVRQGPDHAARAIMVKQGTPLQASIFIAIAHHMDLLAEESWSYHDDDDFGPDDVADFLLNQ